MPARPVWKGQIRLALVSIPVEVYPATKAGSGIQFRQIHEPSGQAIKYEKVVPGIGPVKADEILKGYELGEFVALHERVFRSATAEPFEVMSIYSFEGDKVSRVEFVR